jgi:hypothetical protein
MDVQQRVIPVKNSVGPAEKPERRSESCRTERVKLYSNNECVQGPAWCDEEDDVGGSGADVYLKGTNAETRMARRPRCPEPGTSTNGANSGSGSGALASASGDICGSSAIKVFVPSRHAQARLSRDPPIGGRLDLIYALSGCILIRRHVR